MNRSLVSSHIAAWQAPERLDHKHCRLIEKMNTQLAKLRMGCNKTNGKRCAQVRIDRQWTVHYMVPDYRPWYEQLEWSHSFTIWFPAYVQLYEIVFLNDKSMTKAFAIYVSWLKTTRERPESPARLHACAWKKIEETLLWTFSLTNNDHTTYCIVVHYSSTYLLVCHPSI